MADIPPALLNFFRSAYSSLRFNEEWLSDCVTYLRDHFDPLTTQQLIKQVEEQLLFSDLAVSTIPHDALLPDGDLSNVKSMRVGPTKGKGMLVQINAIEEIGHPALALLEIHQNRIEEKSILAEGRVPARVVGLDAEEVEEGAEFALPKFPRSMLALQLSDGHNTIRGIEYSRLKDLSLEDTPLGAKLMLKDVICRRGTLMLTPENCTYKGYLVQAMQDDADEQLLRILKIQLGKDPDEGAEEPTQAERRPSPPRPVPRNNAPREAVNPQPRNPAAQIGRPLAQAPQAVALDTSSDGIVEGDTFLDFDLDEGELIAAAEQAERERSGSTQGIVRQQVVHEISDSD